MITKRPRFWALVGTGLLTLFTLSLSLLGDVTKALGEEGLERVNIEWLGIEADPSLRSLFLAKVFLIFVITGATVAVQYFRVYRPYVSIDKLRKASLDMVFPEPVDKLQRQLETEVRFCVMKRSFLFRLTRHFYFSELYPIYHYGFKSDASDRHVSFKVVNIFSLWRRIEGVCGLALVEEDVVSTIPGEHKSQLSKWYRMPSRKRKLTRKVEYVISVPILKFKGEDPRVVGTLNVDVRDQEVAKFIASKKRAKYVSELEDYLQDCAAYVSMWL